MFKKHLGYFLTRKDVKKEIFYLAMDGRVWFRYLEEQGYTYIIRLCKGDYQLEVKKYHSLLKKDKSGKLVSQEFETNFAKN